MMTNHKTPTEAPANCKARAAHGGRHETNPPRSASPAAFAFPSQKTPKAPKIYSTHAVEKMTLQMTENNQSWYTLLDTLRRFGAHRFFARFFTPKWDQILPSARKNQPSFRQSTPTSSTSRTSHTIPVASMQPPLGDPS
jgi:hypothetical protein